MNDSLKDRLATNVLYMSALESVTDDQRKIIEEQVTKLINDAQFVIDAIKLLKTNT